MVSIVLLWVYINYWPYSCFGAYACRNAAHKGKMDSIKGSYEGEEACRNVASDGIMTSDVMTMKDSCNSGTFRECYDIQTDADLPEKMLHCHSFALVDLSAAIMETKL